MTTKKPATPAPAPTDALTTREVLDSRAAWLSKNLDKCGKRADAAASKLSFVAASSYDREARVTRKELDETLGQIAALNEAAGPPRAVTPEEFAAQYAEWLAAATIDDLERALEVWAQRVGAVLVVEGGRPHLRYRSAG